MLGQVEFAERNTKSVAPLLRIVTDIKIRGKAHTASADRVAGVRRKGQSCLSRRSPSHGRNATWTRRLPAFSPTPLRGRLAGICPGPLRCSLGWCKSHLHTGAGPLPVLRIARSAGHGHATGPNSGREHRPRASTARKPCRTTLPHQVSRRGNPDPAPTRPGPAPTRIQCPMPGICRLTSGPWPIE